MNLKDTIETNNQIMHLIYAKSDNCSYHALNAVERTYIRHLLKDNEKATKYLKTVTAK